MRSIRVVSRAKRKKVGILTTQVKLFGGFDFQSKAQNQEWSIVAELRKQYEVAQMPADADYPAGSRRAAGGHALHAHRCRNCSGSPAWVKSGRPTLLLLDPMPAFDLNLAPEQAAAKPNLKPLLDLLGVSWQANRIAWDNYNPHPQLKSLPKEFIFVGKGFNAKEPVSAGLQEVVLLYPGILKNNGNASFAPLLETTSDSGVGALGRHRAALAARDAAVNPDPPHNSQGKPQVLAARVKGAVNAIVVADVDLMSEQFFELRRRGIENLNFDNVTFLLNAVDQLAGDASFIALRKRRPRQRTLEAVEARTKAYEAQRLRNTELAEAQADQRLKEAQARLDRAVREVRARTDLDDQTKEVMIENLQSVETRRLSVARTNIEDDKQRQIENSRADMENSIRGIQNTIKLLAVALPPIPAFLVFLIVSVRRLRRERIGVPVDRLVKESA